MDHYDNTSHNNSAILYNGPVNNTYSAIISFQILHLFHKVMASFWFLVSLCGIFTNHANTRIFYKCGLHSSANLSFFALSISDLCLCSSAFIELIAFLIMVLEVEYNFSMYLPATIVAHYIVMTRRIFNVTTILITTFLALQRCMCIVLPFQVKGLFNKQRTIYFMTITFTFSVTTHILYIWRHQVAKVLDPITNVTHFKTYIPPGSEPYLWMIEAFIGIGLNLLCQFVVFVCVIVMGVKLKKSQQFRQVATTANFDAVASTVTLKTIIKSKVAITDISGASSKGINTVGGCNTTRENPSTQPAVPDNQSMKDKTTTTKEFQALMQVVLVSMIFIITNSPYLVYGIANVLIPEFSMGQKYHNLYHLVHNLMFTFEIMNSSINFLIYLKYNSKYRSLFLQRNVK